MRIEKSGGSPLEDRFDVQDGTVHLTGMQALVRLPLDLMRADRAAGNDTALFISGYEGSPLAGFDLQLSKQQQRLDENSIVFKPSVNEELAATAVQGSQLASASDSLQGDGVVGIWYGKAPGLDRATDAIRHANLEGTHPSGGVLALVGDDAIAKSSTVPSTSEMAIADLGMPCLAPSDPQEILELGMHGVAMSRASGLWVAMKLATNVVDGSGEVALTGRAVERRTPDLTFDGEEFRHTPTARLAQPILTELEASQTGPRKQIALRYAAANRLNRINGDPAATIGVVAAGVNYSEVHEALTQLGITDANLGSSGVRLLKLGMVSPLEPSIVREFAAGLAELIVVEEKKPFLEHAIKDELYDLDVRPAVVGRKDTTGAPLFKSDGDLAASYLAPRLAKRLVAHGAAESVAAWLAENERPKTVPIMLPLVPRVPYFCSGCPHNASTRVPEGSLVGAGIGCHGMAARMSPERVGDMIGLCAMGGEGAAWIGMEPFVSQDHLFQNLGDGTYHHSGSLAIRAAIAAGSHITYKLLYNDAVAMTGGQQAVGRMEVPGVVQELLAEGVAKIVITSDDPQAVRAQFGRLARLGDLPGLSRIPGNRMLAGVGGLPAGVAVRDRDDLITVQEELAATPGVTVLIHQQECATELRRKRKRGKVEAPPERIVINERVCEGCGDCGDQSNCMSVQPVATEYGRKTRIHQSSCNLDFSCIKGDCPSFVEVVPASGSALGATAKKWVQRAGRRVAQAAEAATGFLRHPAPGGAGLVSGGTTPNVGALPGGGQDDAKARPGAASAALFTNPIDPDTLPAPAPVVDTADFRMRVAGIGGTGVVTVAQVLVAAAQHAGLESKGLDQLGLAQKGGAVISDLRISTVAITGSNKIGVGGADLILACDMLTAVSPDNLAVIGVDRTYVVASTAETPTGEMVTNTKIAYPGLAELRSRLEWGGNHRENRFVDALSAVGGSDPLANVFLVGVACQSGVLPLAPADIEWALDLNGVDVQRNLQAFRAGRAWVVEQDLAAHPDAPTDGTANGGTTGSARTEGEHGLASLIADRTAELTAYQDARYAADYLARVEAVRDSEAERLDTTDLTEEYARQLFKLMAYKDEYEVARLAFTQELEEQITTQFGAEAEFKIMLHPPILRAMGMKNKLKMASWWAKPAMDTLYALRGLRGTRLDPFGHTEVRRTERNLVTEYIDAVSRAMAAVTSETRDAVAKLIGLPDVVRGYEQIKLDNVADYRAQQDSLLFTIEHRTVPEPATVQRSDGSSFKEES